MKGKFEDNFEEAVLECEVCGKKVKRVIRKGAVKKFLCQKCGKTASETE